jgi:hypothetical protein
LERLLDRLSLQAGEFEVIITIAGAIVIIGIPELAFAALCGALNRATIFSDHRA